MKLKTKLIPAIGLATLASVSMPMAMTGCSKKGGMVNLLKKYVPKGKQMKSEFIEDWEAITNYSDVISRNKKIFTQDMIWSKFKFVDAMLHSAIPAWKTTDSSEQNVWSRRVMMTINSVKSAKFGISNLRVDQQEVEVEVSGETVNVWYPVLSFTLSYSMYFDVFYDEVLEHDVGSTSGQIIVTELPFAPQPSYASAGAPSLWVIGPAFYEIEKADSEFDNWEIQYLINTKVTQSLEVGGAQIVTKFDKDFDYIFTKPKLGNLTEDQEDVWKMLHEPESDFVENAVYVSDKSTKIEEQRTFRVDTIFSKGIFTLTSYSWYMLPVPTRK